MVSRQNAFTLMAVGDKNDFHTKFFSYLEIMEGITDQHRIFGWYLRIFNKLFATMNL